MRMRTLLLSVVLLLSLSVGAWGERRREIHFPDLPGHTTLKCDFHVHTVYSDGQVWPTVRVEEAWREGLDAIALTDHIEYQPHKDDLPTNHNRPVVLAADGAAEKNIILIRGAEITRDTPPGHHNAIFLKDVHPLDTPDFYDVFDAAAAQGAFIFWNHPGWKGLELGRWGEAQTKLLEKKQLHGIEFCNGGTLYADACREAYERDLALIGNSDIHTPSSDQEWTPEEHRTLTLVFAQERSEEGIRKALFAKRTAVWFSNKLFGRKEHMRPLFEKCIEILPAHQRQGNTVWTEIRNLCELNLDLERVGQGHPGAITLPALRTSLVRFNVSGAKDVEQLPYRLKNILVGPEKPLEVELAIPLGEPAKPKSAAAAPK